MRLIGYGTEEVMGRSLVQEFITDDFKTAVQAVLDQALAGDETDNFEFPLITKGGARIEVLLNATTRRDEQGNVIGVVGIGQDITARLAQEREYSKLIDTANAPIFGVDTQVCQCLLLMLTVLCFVHSAIIPFVGLIQPHHLSNASLSSMLREVSLLSHR